MPHLDTAVPRFHRFYDISVGLRNDLADDVWTEQPNLYVHMLDRAANKVSVAKLSIEIGAGVIHPKDDAAFDDVPVFDEDPGLDLRGTYVRISEEQPDLDPPTTSYWYGYVTGEWKERDGVKIEEDPDDNKLIGKRRVYMAVGLEYFLQRTQVADAVVHKPAVGPEDDAVRLRRPLVFNGGKSVLYDSNTVQRGNRHPDTQLEDDGGTPAPGDEVYAFSDGSATPVLWSVRDVARHLFRYHAPLDSLGEKMPCRYAIASAELFQAILGNLYFTLPTERRSVWDILDDALNPKRGLYMWFNTAWDPDESEFVCKLAVNTRAMTSISLPGGGSLAENFDQQSLNFDGNIAEAIEPQRELLSIAFREDDSTTYDQVRVRGARMTVTCTLGMEDGSLEPNWTNSLEIIYKNAVSSDPEDAKKNDIFREDEALAAVYSQFRIPIGWNGTTGSGIGTAPLNPCMPEIAIDGTIGDPLPHSVHYLRLLNLTRLLEGYSYFASASNPAPIYDLPANTEPEHVRPFAFFIYQPVGGGELVAREAHHLAKKLGPVADLTTNYNLAMLDNVAGFELPAGDGQQHKLAGDVWVGANPSNSTPELGVAPGDSYSAMACTVCFEADAFAEAKYPATLAHVPVGKPVEILDIDLGDNYRLDFLAGNTVFMIDNSEDADGTPILAAGGVMRNDQPYLADVARMAYEWYRVDRQPVTIKLAHIKECFRLGMLITTIGEGSTQETINSVVTRILVDYDNQQQTVMSEDRDLNFK